MFNSFSIHQREGEKIYSYNKCMMPIGELSHKKVKERTAGRFISYWKI